MKKFTFLFLLILPVVLYAQDSKLVDEFSGMMEYNATQIKALAAAIPEEVYDWTPQEGVRTTADVINHISSAWYMMSSMLGAELPEGLEAMKMEENVKGKEDILEAFDASYAFVMKTVKELPEENYGDMVYFPPIDSEVSKRFVILLILDHGAEHKGQLIAYARSNEVVPPWSQ